ncbi:MAG: hypothetical protein PHP42_08315 [Bacteroidota bacterium]|nr:hypothetical protein [Bacteroidota bacterium]
MKQYKHLDELFLAYHQRGKKIRKRLREYAQVPVEKYFYELAYCLMTPQSSAVNAGKVQVLLEEHDFLNADFNPEPFLLIKEHYVRFHKTKAKWLMEMKMQFPSIIKIIRSNHTAVEKREWLVHHVKGLSYKESTHFLRNIGENGGLAILDRHILRNLKHYGVLRLLPLTVTKKHYLSIEKKFQKFSTFARISVDELDLLFWSNETGEILK